MYADQIEPTTGEPTQTMATPPKPRRLRPNGPTDMGGQIPTPTVMPAPFSPSTLPANVDPPAPPPFNAPTIGMPTAPSIGDPVSSDAMVGAPGSLPAQPGGLVPGKPGWKKSEGVALLPPPLPPTSSTPAAPVTMSTINPANDLRSQSILPTDNPQLAAARGGLVDANANTNSFDRLKSIRDAVGALGTTPTDVAGGPAVNAGPSEQGSLDTLNGQVTDAAGKVAGYDRNADLTSQRDALSKYFGPTDVNAGAAVGTAPSDRLAKMNTAVDDSASKLASVDRVQMMKDLLAQFDEEQAPNDELALRKLTEKFAAQGGGRSGMLRTSYGDYDLTRERDRDLKKKELMTNALEGSIQDQFNKTSALSSLQGTTAGQEASARGEERTDRGYSTDVATGNVNRSLSTKEAANTAAGSTADANYGTKTGALSTLANVQGATAGRESNRRGEARTERDTATGLNERNAERATSANQANVALGTNVAAGTAADNAQKSQSAQSLFNSLTNEGVNNRAETRGERANENALEQQSFERGVTQHQMEGQDEDRAQKNALDLLGAGDSQNPANILATLANGGGLDANTIAQLAQSLGRGSGTAGTPAPSTNDNPLAGLSPEIIQSIMHAGGLL